MTLIDTLQRRRRAPAPAVSPAQRLQTRFAAVSVSFTWLGLRKTLTPDQKAQAAEPFGARRDYLSASKKLLDTRSPQFREVTAVRHRILAFWKGMTLPYPDPGLRLIRQEDLDRFQATLTDLRDELQDAVAQLEEHYAALKAAAQERLGALYQESDYPAGLRGLFDCTWEFPSVDAPDYLARLNPKLFEAEQARIAARFEEAVRLAEQAFLSEFADLVSHLVERLGGTGPEAPKKVFRDGVIGHLREFFDRFRALNVQSNPQLDELVEAAQKAVAGIAPQDLRDQEGLRQHVATQMATVLSALDGLLVDAPRRRVLRPAAVSPQVA